MGVKLYVKESRGRIPESAQHMQAELDRAGIAFETIFVDDGSRPWFLLAGGRIRRSIEEVKQYLSEKGNKNGG